MLIEKVIASKQAKIRLYPTHTNRASELGHPCERYLVFKRTRWQDATLHDVGLQFVFDEGNLQERAVIRDLEDAGWQIVEQQRDYEWKDFQITAHLDGKIALPDSELAPMEVKSMSPFIWVKINTVADLLNAKYPHLRKYPAQLTLYNLLANAHRGFLILKNKSTGQLKEIEIGLDYEYAESLLQKAKRINAHVADKTVPDPISYDESICGRCPFLHICLPDVKREALVLADDPELEAQLIRRAELDPMRRAYGELDEAVKEKFLRANCEKALVGNFLLVKKDGQRNGKTFPIVKIDRLQPTKEIEA